MQRFILPDGRMLAYRDVGSGPALVLLHGWGMAGGVFSRLRAALSASFRLLIPDLKGHGNSSPGEGYRRTDFATDLEAWLSALELPSLHLLGWSFGGQVALELALRRRIPLDRLILVATTPKFCADADWQAGLPTGEVKVLARSLRRGAREALDDFFVKMFVGDTTGPGLELTPNGAALPDLDAAVRTLDTLADGDLRDRVAALDCPTLIEHGQGDRIIPVAAGEWLAGQIPAARGVFIDGAGHAPFISRPERSVAIWKEFLA